MKKRERIIGLVVSVVVGLIVVVICEMFGLNEHLTGGIGAFIGLLVGWEVRDRIRER